MSFASSVRNQGSNRNLRPQESVQVSVWRSGWWVNLEVLNMRVMFNLCWNMIQLLPMC
jgi:hypothetical protein